VGVGVIGLPAAAAAAGSPGSSAALVGALVDLGAGRLTVDDIELRGWGPVARQRPSGVERALTVDQTHRSVVVDETWRVKWLRSTGSAAHPALRLLAHLRAVGFSRLPQPVGVLLRGGVPLAYVDAYLPGARDGWEWCVDRVLAVPAGGRDGGFPADLGALVADLLVALATPSDVVPVPVALVDAEVVAGWRAQAEDLLDAARRLDVAADQPAWLPHWDPLLRDVLDRLGSVDRTVVQPVHADLHVGQVLAWDAGLAVTDFDGHPVVTEAADLAPAARDVASMLASLDHVARIADRRTDRSASAVLRRWAKAAQASFLTAVDTGLAAAGRDDLLDVRLLGPFLVEQECRDLVYAARHLPRWRYAPWGTLAAWFGTAPDDPSRDFPWT